MILANLIPHIQTDFPDWTFNFYCKGDDHIGSAASSDSLIKKEVDIIANDPLGIWGNGGDGLETIFVGDRRFQLDVHRGKDARLGAQVRHWVSLHESIIFKMKYYLDGNHEETIENMDLVGERIAEKIYDKYGHAILYGGRTIKVALTPYFNLFYTHGAGQVNSQAGDPDQIKLNDEVKIKRKLRNKAGDCIVMGMGHIHKLRVRRPSRKLYLVGHSEEEYTGVYREHFALQEGIIHEDSRYYFANGSAHRAYVPGMTGYPEKMMLDPTEPGMVKIEVVNGHVKDVKEIYV